ncbi:MAG: DUF4402 domain-containing protein [Alphaproteobacteria bacterium]
MARRATKARICLTGALAAAMVSGLATGIEDAAATVTSVTVKKDLQFGDVAGDADLGGTVVVSPAGGKSVTGGVTDFGGAHKKADVQLKGDNNGTYACTLPGSTQVTSGADSATVDTFMTDVPLTGFLDNKGKAKIRIGATLHLAAGQAAGSYSGTFDIICDGISGTVDVTATILAPISISAGGDMDFGTMVPTGIPGGTVTVTPAGAISSVDVDLFGGFPAAAAFDVTGASGQAYSITLPLNGTVALTGPGAPMAVDAFTDDAGANPILVGGSDTFNVGATLNVGATQASGTYSGTFSVTVNYN